MERNAVAHLGVQASGTVAPLCGSWRSTWNWTVVPSEVTCPQCRAALTGRDGAGAARRKPPER
jgi:hypothetical protein